MKIFTIEQLLNGRTNELLANFLDDGVRVTRDHALEVDSDILRSINDEVALRRIALYNDNGIFVPDERGIHLYARNTVSRRIMCAPARLGYTRVADIDDTVNASLGFHNLRNYVKAVYPQSSENGYVTVLMDNAFWHP